VCVCDMYVCVVCSMCMWCVICGVYVVCMCYVYVICVCAVYVICVCHPGASFDGLFASAFRTLDRESVGEIPKAFWSTSSLAWTPTQPWVAEFDIKQQSPFTLFFSNLPGFT